MERMQFTFYRSFWETIRKVKSDKDRLAVYDAICSYSLDGIVPDLSGEADLAFTSFKRTLDYARIRAERGRKGGKTSIASNNCESNRTSIASTSGKSNGNGNGNNNGNVNGNENVNGNGSGAAGAPSLPEVVAFFKDKNLNGDPNEFFYYYQGRGWEGVKDWTGYAYNWSIKERKFNDDDGSNDPIILGGTRFPPGVTPQTVSGDGKFKLI